MVIKEKNQIKARSYFILSLKLDPAPKTYAAYAKLLQELGDLALGAADFAIDFTPLTAVTAEGGEEITFLFSANPGVF